MAKYDCAFYKENGEFKEVGAYELVDDEKRAILKEKILFDKSKKINLGIRNHSVTPHFYRKSFLRGDINSGEPKDTSRHNDTRDDFIYFLNNDASSTSSTKMRIGIYEYSYVEKKNIFSALNVLNNYEWNKEVKFSISEDSFIRFDILGRSKTAFGWTEKNPLIAIEIVDSHFSSKEAFTELLKLTKEFPIIIGYMFCEILPFLNTKKNGGRSNSPKHVRFKYYLMDGKFWDQDKPIDDELELITNDQRKEYFNYVYEKIQPHLKK